MARRSLAGALLAAALLAGMAHGLRIAPSERLREVPLDRLPMVPPAVSATQLGEDVPVVNPPTRVAGYFKLDRTKAAEMFYFFFQARKTPTIAPVVLWMTGGPGCSSELAVLYENGPYTLNKAGTALEETPYGWDVLHNMIYVDQPIGTGFSYSDDDADTVYGEAGVAEDMLDFLHNFFAAHPELAGLPLYVTGESYAGHYVPAVSHRVWLSNKNKEGPYINFKGLAVGNGLTEPTSQFDAYGDFAVQNGLIGTTTRSVMSLLFPLCRLANKWCESTSWDWVCALGLTYCQLTQFEPILDANPGINVYDISKACEGELCYDFTAADRFLNSKAVQEALGVSGRDWVSCNYDVYNDFSGDWLHRFDTVLPDMLADGVRVMIYAGDLDLICNYVGNRRWVDALEWAGSEAWAGAKDQEWVVAGKAAGKVKQVGPLSFVQVYKAGHMVPMDQPLHALAMISVWTRNMSLVKYNLPVLGAVTDGVEVAEAGLPHQTGCGSQDATAASSDAAGLAGGVAQQPCGRGGFQAGAMVQSLLSGAVAKASGAAQAVLRQVTRKAPTA